MAVPDPDRKTLLARWFDRGETPPPPEIGGESLERLSTTTTPGAPTPEVDQAIRAQLDRPPRLPQGPLAFVQRMTFETDLLTQLNSMQYLFTTWGYEFAYRADRYLWAYYTTYYFLVKLSSQSPAAPSLVERWKATETRVSMQERPLRMLEMALGEAHRLGLTLRTHAQPFRPLPRDKLAPLLDPERKVENLEEIGIAQLAGEIAKAAPKRRDFFGVIDVSSRIPQFGAGKSQLMVQLLASANALLGRAFDLRWDVVFGVDHGRFRRLLNDRTPLVVWGVDELDQFAYAREAMRGENKTTIQTLKRTRKWGRPVLAACGSIWQLDPFLRDVKVTHRIRVDEWDDERYEGRASVWSKGGWPDPQNDIWGRIPPMMSFHFYGLAHESFALYSAIVDKAEETAAGGLDKWLAKNPDWLLDGEKTPVLTPITPESNGGKK